MKKGIIFLLALTLVSSPLAANQASAGMLQKWGGNLSKGWKQFFTPEQGGDYRDHCTGCHQEWPEDDPVHGKGSRYREQQPDYNETYPPYPGSPIYDDPYPRDRLS